MSSGNDEEYLASKGLAAKLTEVNRQLTSSHQGLHQAYKELKEEGLRQEVELQQAQTAVESLQKLAADLHTSLKESLDDKEKAVEAARAAGVQALAEKDREIESLTAKVKALDKSAKAQLAEANLWKSKHMSKSPFLVLFAFLACFFLDTAR